MYCVSDRTGGRVARPCRAPKRRYALPAELTCIMMGTAAWREFKSVGGDGAPSRAAQARICRAIPDYCLF